MNKTSQYRFTVVVPVYNEAENIDRLEETFGRYLAAAPVETCVLFVNDGSTDDSWDVIRRLAESNPAVKGVSFRRNYGKSPALNTGFVRAQGDVVITMDADLQDSPDEIPALYDMIKNEGYDLVSGWKQKRYDPLSKTIPTKLFNATARRVSGIKNLHDFNCGLKAYRHKVIERIEVYGDMHRYIPYLAKTPDSPVLARKWCTIRHANTARQNSVSTALSTAISTWPPSGSQTNSE